MIRCRKLYVEGTVGVGKSTVLQLLSREPGFVVLPEPLEEWKGPVAGSNLLRDIYSPHPANKGELPAALMRLQLLIQATLHEREVQARQILEGSPSSIVVLERAPSSALVFLEASPDLDRRDREVLQRLVRSQLRCQPEEGRSVLLTAEPTTLLARVRGRARPEEEGIKGRYIQELDEKFTSLALERGWLIIDTTRLSPRLVADRVLQHAQ